MLLLTKKLLHVLSCFDAFFQSGHLQRHFSLPVLLPNKTRSTCLCARKTLERITHLLLKGCPHICKDCWRIAKNFTSAVFFKSSERKTVRPCYLLRTCKWDQVEHSMQRLKRLHDSTWLTSRRIQATLGTSSRSWEHVANLRWSKRCFLVSWVVRRCMIPKVDPPLKLPGFRAGFRCRSLRGLNWNLTTLRKNN